jgi:hypothetical protein
MDPDPDHTSDSRQANTIKHPEGRTLWEMFQDWMHGSHGADHSEHRTSNYQHPLDWAPGVPAPLNVSHGPEFADSLIVVETVRQVVRKLAGQSYDFIDYHIRVNPRQGQMTHVRVRCLPNSLGGWDKFLLRKHDEFSYDKDFETMLDDDSGVFNIDDDPSGQQVQFVRLNQLQGAWEAAACDHHNADNADESAKEPFKKFRYWDYSRPPSDNADAEEFLYIEIDGQTGWTELWRGSSMVV